jgi:hypothetical protein
VGNQLAIPSQNGVGPGHGGNLGQSFAPESLADFGQHGSFRIGQAQSGGQVCTQNSIFCCQVFILEEQLEEQLLVDQTGHVGEQTYPLVLFHLDRP